MDLFTLKDLKRKSGSPSKQELIDFEERMIGGAGSAESFDVFLSHPGLPVALLYTIETLFRERGFTFLTSPGNKNGSRTLPALLKTVFPRCQSLVIVDLKENRFTWQDYHQIGYFACLKNRIAVLPVLKKDINTAVYNGRGLLGQYPYLASGMVFMENRETLWVVKNPESFVDFEYWLSADPDYIEW